MSEANPTLSDLLHRLALDPKDSELADLVITTLLRMQYSPKLNAMALDLEELLKTKEFLVRQVDGLSLDLYEWRNRVKNDVTDKLRNSRTLKNVLNATVGPDEISREDYMKELLVEEVNSYLEGYIQDNFDFITGCYVHDLIDYDDWIEELKQID